MKKIFIDGGARIGESIDILLKKRPDLNGCDVYFYECNPNHIPTLHQISKSNKDYNIIVRNEAIWCRNEVKKFYFSIDRWGDLGCTLMPEKRELLDKKNPIEVKCIDLSEILNNFDDNTYIVLKLDVEGAEYEILESLINNKSILKINELYVEFHDHFFNISSNDLKNKLLSYNINCHFDWE